MIIFNLFNVRAINNAKQSKRFQKSFIFFLLYKNIENSYILRIYENYFKFYVTLSTELRIYIGTQNKFNIMEQKTAIEQIENILKSKGQFVGVRFQSEGKPSASFKNFKLRKETHAVVRAGIDYENIAKVKADRASGEKDATPNGLPWGNWFKFPYIIENKGAFYIRLYPSTNNIPKVKYFVNDKEVTKQEYASYLTPSNAEKVLNPTENRTECFTLKASNVLDIV